MKTTNFLQTDYTLLASTSISILNKCIIARALSFQVNNLKYYESSLSMSKTFGVGKDAITNQLKVLKQLPFVTFNTVSNFEQRGKTRFIIIDEKGLTNYLNSEAEANKAKEKKSPTIKERPVSTIKATPVPTKEEQEEAGVIDGTQPTEGDVTIKLNNGTEVLILAENLIYWKQLYPRQQNILLTQNSENLFNFKFKNYIEGLLIKEEIENNIY